VNQGWREDTYAVSAIRSSSMIFSTAGFITFAASPLRAPSYSRFQ
jgi:hypothetical protein